MSQKPISPLCDNEPIADGNGRGADGVIYPGDPAHCPVCHVQDGLRKIRAVRDREMKIITEPCPNCGTYRTWEKGVLLECPYCGDEETEPVDPKDVP